VRTETVQGKRGDEKRTGKLFKSQTVGINGAKSVPRFRGEETLARRAIPFGVGKRETDRRGEHHQTGVAEKLTADTRPLDVFDVETCRAVHRKSVRRKQIDEIANGTIRRPEKRGRVRAETFQGQRGGDTRPTTLFERPTVGRADTKDVPVFRGEETLAGDARPVAVGNGEARRGSRHGETSAETEPAGHSGAGRVRRAEVRRSVRAADVASKEPDEGATGMVHDVAVRHRVRAADVSGKGRDEVGPPGVLEGQAVGGDHPKSVPRLRGQARVAGCPGPAGCRPGGTGPRSGRDQASPPTPVAGRP